MKIFILVFGALGIGLACTLGTYLGLLRIASFSRIQVESNSMFPALLPESRVIVDTNAYRHHLPERGDIVIVRIAGAENPFIKRIVGLPGEQVNIRGGSVYINGIMLNEPYLGNAQMHTPVYKIWNLSDSEYFLMGDARNASFDSRSWGPIQADQILGRATWIYSPVKKFGPIPRPTYPELED